jgi:mannitol-1-phosphate 5-dehydrogenase
LTDLKKAVVYGSGKIGRGFIGKIFAESGYRVCFLDRIQALVDGLNAAGAYTVRIVSNDDWTDSRVPVDRALISTTDEALEAIAGCDLMATSVGANELEHIAPVLAKAVALRMARHGGPLDVILCENQLGADTLMRGWINGWLDDAQRAWADRNLGLVEASISRMVPPQPPEQLAQDPLLLRVDPSSELPVDSAAFRGPIPDLVGIIPYTPFDFYMKRKLFLNNGSHALCAYMGYEKGLEYIWQAIADPEIQAAVRASMQANADALVAKYGEGVRQNVQDYIEDLVIRYPNRALNDTVARVGADPVRKLRRNDRIVGAALFALEQGVDPAPIVRGILAALRFDLPQDPTAPRLQQALKEQGIEAVMEQFMGLAPDEPLYDMIRAAYARQ